MRSRGVKGFGAACAAAGLLTGALTQLGAPPAGAQRADAPKVLVATTGNDSERERTVPITRRAGAERRVVMSMRPRKLPDLKKGDRLDLTAELQVTDDCYKPNPSCVGRPYFFNPEIGFKLALARRAGETHGKGVMPLSARRVISCRGKLPGRQHHCVLVFKHVSLRIHHPRALPCALRSCHVNFIVDAHSPHARRGDKLVIGANKPDGRVLQDKGRINAIRLRPGSQPRPHAKTTGKRRHTHVPLDETPTVILSQRLNALKRNDQLAVWAKMKTAVFNLPYSARVTTQLILAAHRGSTTTNHRVGKMASLRGAIAESNGSNCTRIQSPCPYAKVGVLRMLRDATNRAGAPVPLFVNLVVISNPKRASRRPGDQLNILPHVSMRVLRYPAALRG
jgi:hypothetical protein